MPRGDGMGPMSGRMAGFCAGYHIPGYLNRDTGYGSWMPQHRVGRSIGRGFRTGGFGRRNRFYATGMPGWLRFGTRAMSYSGASPELEKQELKTQADYLQKELDMIRKRIEEIDKEADRK